MMGKQTIGQAYDKAQRYIYTWYTDGTVDRHLHEVLSSGSVLYGWYEPIEPPVQWNENDFMAFVPVEGNEE